MTALERHSVIREGTALLTEFYVPARAEAPSLKEACE